ncbi:MAG: MraY family glycosyltransferase [Nitrospirota bacterium]
MYTMALAAMISFGVALAILPFLSRFAFRIGLLDYPEERKVHAAPKPLVGGIGITLALFVSALLFVPNESLYGLYAGSAMLLVIGFIDDYRESTHRWKFLVQIFAAIVMMNLSRGTFLLSFGDIFSTGAITLGVLAVPATIFCTIGVVNAINMADGLDGLAGGISLIALSTFAAAAYIDHQTDLFMLALVLIGALIGFLRYNWYPSKLFMGDSGSLVLGFILAFFSIRLTQQSGAGISPVVPLLVLAVPIIDTVTVMFKRMFRNKSPFCADNNHMHHLLMKLGFSHMATVMVILSITAFFALVALCGTVARLHDYFFFTVFACYFVLHVTGSFVLDLFINRGIIFVSRKEKVARSRMATGL